MALPRMQCRGTPKPLRTQLRISVEDMHRCRRSGSHRDTRAGMSYVEPPKQAVARSTGIRQAFERDRTCPALSTCLTQGMHACSAGNRAGCLHHKQPDNDCGGDVAPWQLRALCTAPAAHSTPPRAVRGRGSQAEGPQVCTQRESHRAGSAGHHPHQGANSQRRRTLFPQTVRVKS